MPLAMMSSTPSGWPRCARHDNTAVPHIEEEQRGQIELVRLRSKKPYCEGHAFAEDTSLRAERGNLFLRIIDSCVASELRSVWLRHSSSQ